MKLSTLSMGVIVRTQILSLLVLGLCLAGKASYAAIEYTDSQAETAAELVHRLENRHYSKRKFDGELSGQMLDNYFKSLDPGHMFLLQDDILEFEQYRSKLNEHISSGNLEAGFKIFNRYQQRVEERLEALLADLPAMVANMDFSLDESLMLNTEQRAWANSTTEADERWRKQLKNAVLSLKLAGKNDEEIEPVLRKRYENQLHRIAQYNSQDVFQVYANALTELYDPHTNYLSPRTSENFNINMSLSLEGIGAVLQLEDDYTKVSRIVPAGPAHKQGQLKPSDRIIAVGQDKKGELVDVIGWRLDEVVQLIRGDKGSTVRLEVIPANAKTPDERQIITIVRNRVKLEEQSAQKKIIEVTDDGQVKKLGVIDIPAFYIDFEALRRGEEDYKSTTRDVKRLLDELVAESVDGIIIDLRNNGGGSLQEANELTGLFIEYGPTVQIRHSSRKVFRNGKRLRTPYYKGPLAVLINRLSASASEIFAGAIQDYQRGVIVGDQSFGKGTVQTLIPLQEGQLKLTESKFYRISGESTQHRGVIPDLEFPSHFDKEEIGESALDHALDWDKITGVRHRKYHDIPAAIPQLNDWYEERTKDDPDFVYLRDSVVLAAAVREIKTLPLNEKARIALRDTQKEKALAIENKRRLAKGLEPLAALDSTAEEKGEPDANSELADEAIEAESEADILLTQSGVVLVNLLNKNQALASNP